MCVSDSEPTAVVLGGGYGGVQVAKGLDGLARVVLVEPKDAFQHNVAALRALVDPSWPSRIFLPYDGLLVRGTVLRDAAARVDGTQVTLASGRVLRPDYLVLATGSTYPFPAKTDRPDAAASVERYHVTRRHLARASRVLLLGAGAVGLELAGEIMAAWPDKQVTLVDVADDVLPGHYDPRLREELDRQLDALGVRRVLGSPVVTPPATPAAEVGVVSVSTGDGTRIEADIWFRCYGVAPASGYLVGDLAAARTPQGDLPVTPHLNVVGFERVYALGDLATIDVKTAGAASRQAAVVAANIAAGIDADPGRRQAYAPRPPGIVLPLGPTGGAGQTADGQILGADAVAAIKGRDMMIDRFVELLGARPVQA